MQHKELKDFMISKFIYTGDMPEDTDFDEPFVQYQINSIAFLKVLVEIEREYGIYFDDEYLVLGNDFGLDDLVEYVIKFREGGY
ncbi:MAG: phosphopantetheine-binding protein [Defluviitaleaceae bacterium]|nr:phosphopantetheine-binding protein [Defluviitaleaceae bacterium]